MMHFNQHKILKLYFLFSLFLFSFQDIRSQDIMMQGWYWDYPKTIDGFNWADTMQNRAAELGTAGFTYMWLPPLSRASFGSGSNGYDPQDLYDLGEYGGGATGFGTRADLDQAITAFNNNGIEVVADVVYNHRDGGVAEDNPSVEGWIEHYNCTKVNAGDNAFPSDRFRCYLPLGGASGNGAGTYYFKIRSASRHPNFHGKQYTVYMETNTVGYQGGQDDENEAGGNGGGDCGQGNTVIQLGVDMIATVDGGTNCNTACGTDEFALTLNAGDFAAAGDTLWIYMSNSGGNYSDHYIYGLWSGAAAQDIQAQIGYQTYTDFTNMPSGQGGMNYLNFKPNGNPTQLNGDWDWLWFFYDYDQDVPGTETALQDWSTWLWNNVGIRGYRMDAVKHFNYKFTGDLLDHFHDNGIDPGMVVGEYFDTNAGTLKGWVDNVQSEMDNDTKNAIDIRVFDFSLREALKNSCDLFGYDARDVFTTGIVDGASGSGFNVVTFVNNHDYRDGTQPVQNDPMLAYAYILTNNQVGLPCVFYSDYFPISVPNYPDNTLKTDIDELIQIQQDYIFGSTGADYLSRLGTPYASNYIGGFPNTTLLYQLSGGIGGKEVIVAINFAGETLKVDHEINMTNLAVGDQFVDLLGNSNFPDATINASNQIYLELPARSYSVWVSQDAPLPAELLNFQVVENETQVDLNWEIAAEVDLAGYAIERSHDGQTFTQIGWKKAQNNAFYKFTDTDPIFNELSYYRLKMLNFDNSFVYSPTRTVQLNQSVFNLQIQPNPTTGKTLLTFNSESNQLLLLKVLSTDGQEMQVFQFAVQKGSNSLELDLSNLSEGLYYINGMLDGVSFFEKVVKI